jgi:acyl dehydratase
MAKQQSLIYDFFSIGQVLPVYTRTVTLQEIDEFCDAVPTNTSIYRDDEAAKAAGLEGRVAPPMMVRQYAHFQNVLTGFDGTIPGHSIHVSGSYEFLLPVMPGDTITTTGKVTDKFIKKGKKFLSFELISTNQRGEKVVVNHHTSIWPK